MSLLKATALASTKATTSYAQHYASLGSNLSRHGFHETRYLYRKASKLSNPVAPNQSKQHSIRISHQAPEKAVQPPPQRDPTLVWAKNYPEEAQSCLQPPQWDLNACNMDFWEHKNDSIEGYCNWRRWPHASSHSSPLSEKALSISSHLLSPPLTCASFRAALQFPQNQKHIQRWCCVGARAEATIPPEYWKEFLLLSSAMASSPVNISLDFVGPDVHAKTPNQTIRLPFSTENDLAAIELRWHYQGLLHEIPSRGNSGFYEWNVYVFLNPGFGHPNLREEWQATLERVVGDKSSLPALLITAHSERDAQRDADHLREHFGLDISYSENPFASRISYSDPFDPEHVVRPNHYVAHANLSLKS